LLSAKAHHRHIRALLGLTVIAALLLGTLALLQARTRTAAAQTETPEQDPERATQDPADNANCLLCHEDSAEEIVFPCGHLLVAAELPADHPQKAILMAYKTAYEERFKEEANSFGGYAWDALAIVLEGVRKSGGSDRAKVRDAIEGLQGFAGVTGVFNYSPADHGGLSLEAFEMLTVKNGAFTVYRPPAAATP